LEHLAKSWPKPGQDQARGLSKTLGIFRKIQEFSFFDHNIFENKALHQDEAFLQNWSKIDKTRQGCRAMVQYAESMVKLDSNEF
jgi:hypothetical protein